MTQEDNGDAISMQLRQTWPAIRIYFPRCTSTAVKRTVNKGEKAIVNKVGQICVSTDSQVVHPASRSSESHFSGTPSNADLRE